jgi:hypothetical protein
MTRITTTLLLLLALGVATTQLSGCGGGGEPARNAAPVTGTAFTSMSTARFDTIAITGTPQFVVRTETALTLLKGSADTAYRKVTGYIGTIVQGEHSGMWAYEEPPRYEVNGVTAFSTVTWYAGTIAHDALHSELYHVYLAANTGPVPDSAWTGEAAEKESMAFQLEVLKSIGAPESEITYLQNLDPNYWKIPYEDRTWKRRGEGA